MGAVAIFWNASTSMVAATLRALCRLGLLGMLWLLPFVDLFRFAVLVLLLGGFLFVPGFVLLFLGSLLFRFGGSVWVRFFLVLLSGLGFLFLFLVVLLLRIRRSRESQSQRQNGCSDDSNESHQVFPPSFDGS